ncbi:MAG: hypothetical protein ACREAW_10585 [Nitrososphaera sp.]
MFKERRTKFALLSLLSALVVVPTAFVGVSIYAQTDDSELTTFEEEAIAGGAEMEDTGLEDDTAMSDNATEDDNATDDGSTSIADVSSLFDGLQVCDVGTAEISGETEVASALEADTTPTVSVEVMTQTEVAELASNETEIAAAGNETSAECVLAGGDNETSTSNDTSTADSNATTGNITGADNATSTLGASNETSIASAPESDEEILVIEGQDFVPGQVVLMFTENALVGIDDVAEDGTIEAKIPMPDSGETAIAGNDTGTTKLRLVESGTQRTATFEFDGETLTAATGGDIEAAEAATTAAPAPSDNATSTNGTSMNDTNDTGTSSSSNTTPQY